MQAWDKSKDKKEEKAQKRRKIINLLRSGHGITVVSPW